MKKQIPSIHGVDPDILPNRDLPCKPLDWREHKLLENGHPDQPGGGLKDFIKSTDFDELETAEDKVKALVDYYSAGEWPELGQVVAQWARKHGLDGAL